MTYTLTQDLIAEPQQAVAGMCLADTAQTLAAEQAARFDSIEERLARIEAHLSPPVGPDAEVPATVRVARRWPPQRRRQGLSTVAVERPGDY